MGHVVIEGGENREMPGTAPSLCGNFKGTDSLSWKRMNHLISGFDRNVYLGENVSRLPWHNTEIHSEWIKDLIMKLHPPHSYLLCENSWDFISQKQLSLLPELTSEDARKDHLKSGKLTCVVHLFSCAPVQARSPPTDKPWQPGYWGAVHSTNLPCPNHGQVTLLPPSPRRWRSAGSSLVVLVSRFVSLCSDLVLYPSPSFPDTAQGWLPPFPPCPLLLCVSLPLTAGLAAAPQMGSLFLCCCYSLSAARSTFP